MRRRSKQFTLQTWQILVIFVGLAVLPFLTNLNYLLPVFIFIVTIAFVIGCLVIIFSKQQEIRKTKALQISDIDNMAGIEFEKYIARLLQAQNYKISFTKISGDFGIDIIANKNQEKYAIQIKRYSKAVGRSAISDAVAGMAYYKCNKTMVVTNNYFTKLAQELAISNNCVLINRDKLGEWIIIYQDGRD